MAGSDGFTPLRSRYFDGVAPAAGSMSRAKVGRRRERVVGALNEWRRLGKRLRGEGGWVD